MGQKPKTKKGEISITDCDGRIRLRWRFNGERYSLNLPFAYTPENIHHATIKVSEIKLDMLKGTFDTSLRKYHFKPVNAVLQFAKPEVNTISYLGELVPKFNEWTKQIRNIDIDNSFDYLYTRKLLEKWGKALIVQIPQKMSGEAWANTTYNRRMGYLKQFFTWLVDSGTIQQNPLLHVIRRRDKRKKKNERRKPITETEIIGFLNAIKNDTYSPTASRFKHSYYYSFLLFIFLTGVRNAEAIGLRVKHIDFVKGQIEISEALARTVKGTNHAARITKGTKMDNVRYLPLTAELRDLLAACVEGKQSEDLVFLSPRGHSIDDRMLERRIVKPVLIKMGIGDRDLYVARHCFGTRAVQQGMAITDVAYLMGHTTIETAIRNYVDVERKSNAFPSLK